MRRSAAVLVAFAAALLALTHGCSDASAPPSCPELPEPNACPAAKGGTCADVTCSAIYSCDDGSWKLAERCGRDGGLPDGADVSDGDASPSCDGLAAPPEFVACTPLEPPDCNATIASACPTQACFLGCDTFLTCQHDGWAARAAAYCDDDRNLVTPPNP